VAPQQHRVPWLGASFTSLRRRGHTDLANTRTIFHTTTTTRTTHLPPFPKMAPPNSNPTKRDRENMYVPPMLLMPYILISSAPSATPQTRHSCASPSSCALESSPWCRATSSRATTTLRTRNGQTPDCCRHAARPTRRLASIASKSAYFRTLDSRWWRSWDEGGMRAGLRKGVVDHVCHGVLGARMQTDTI
jgi:hypothetical protein